MRLRRFKIAQEFDHNIVIRELKKGKKLSCWMWYTFPQIRGLGFSPTAKYYEIQSKYELRTFANDPYLAQNLEECINVILSLRTNDPIRVFGEIDAVKLQSSMTLFLHNRKFKYLADKVLNKFFKGERDIRSEVIFQTLK